MFETQGDPGADQGGSPPLLGVLAVPGTLLLWLTLEGILPGGENWDRYMVGMAGGALLLLLGALSGLRAVRSKQRPALGLIVLVVDGLLSLSLMALLLMGVID